MYWTIFLVIFSEIDGEPFLSLLQDDARSNEQDFKQMQQNKNVKDKPDQLNKRLFKHLLQEKKDPSSPPRIPSCLKASKNMLNVAETDYDETEDKFSIINPVHNNMRQRDLWGNACRQSNDNGGILKYARKKLPTNTIKEALRNRTPVSDFIKEITKANEEDNLKRRERESDRLYIDDVFTDMTENYIVENEAQQIYQEILEVVQAKSPSSLPVSRGRMVGYGEHTENAQIQHTTNLRNTKHKQRSSHNQNKIR